MRVQLWLRNQRTGAKLAISARDDSSLWVSATAKSCQVPKTQISIGIMHIRVAYELFANSYTECRA
jgi:hypothetical protein